MIPYSPVLAVAMGASDCCGVHANISKVSILLGACLNMCFFVWAQNMFLSWQVNGQCMDGKQHSDVVSAIKSGGDETNLLVVDSLTDEFFKKCKVIPSEAHLKGMGSFC